MMRLHWSTSLLILALAPAAALAQPGRRDVIIHFKDNHIVRGRIHELVKGGIFDKESGRYFPLMSGEFLIDDTVRHIKFNPSQVLKVTQLKESEIPKSRMAIRRPAPTNTRPLDPTWMLDRIGEWNEKGERIAYMKAPKGEVPLKQFIAWMTPHYVYAYTVEYNWYPVYSTQEYGPRRTRDFLEHIYGENKDLKKVKPAQKFLSIAGFMQEAGWFKEAEDELVNITVNFPEEKKAAEDMLVKLRKDRAELFVDAIEQARKVGQHETALDKLENYSERGYAKLVSPSYGDKARSLKEEYDQTKLALDEASRFLKDLPKQAKADRAKWTAAAAFIGEELNHDTVDRLDEFIRQAKQYERQRKEKIELTHTVEQVLTFGVTSWLQGKDSFDKDPKVALKLLEARAFLLDPLQGDIGKRADLLKGFRRYNDLPLDVLIKMIRFLPPLEPLPAKQLDTSVQTMKTANGGTYLLQLPPDYHHQRTYPVLMVCHSSRESAEAAMKRVSEEAARNGVILVAPEWSGKKGVRGGGKYTYGAREHDLVLDTLTDLRRQLQVDSDRVFLLGWEEGANMAFDIGLAHPDQFAGVIPMCGSITKFARRWYWPNAQYLPFYIIEGQANTLQVAAMNDLFQEWGRSPFSTTYIEYRGRASEWFSAEVPTIFKWMNCQKRNTPLKALGRHSLKGGLGEEFRSSRNTDTRFYWLSAKGIDSKFTNDHTELKPDIRYQPATFQANLSLGNQLKNGKAVIWNRVIVRTTGLKQVTLWITPGVDMLDLSKPIELIVNGQDRGGMRQVSPNLETLLEELARSGDRQRLFVAKIEIETK